MRQNLKYVCVKQWFGNNILKRNFDIMKDRVKHSKHDFFDSPCPWRYDAFAMHYEKIHDIDEQDIHWERLFNTPARHLRSSPFLQCRSNSQQCSVALQSPELEGGMQEFQQQSVLYFQQKLSFSKEQELLQNITPTKLGPAACEPEELMTTVGRKSFTTMTPSAQATPIAQKFYERGLKKLAFEAFNFVSHQKRTTYKEVARKLISQLNDEGQFQIQRKGEMNVKRRVYDALNVLIALGLLKRNGNKISGKKFQLESSVLGKIASKDKNKRKGQILQEELEHLRTEYRIKMGIMKEKEKTLKIMKGRIDHLRGLVARNMRFNQRREVQMQQERPIIRFPIVSVMIKEHQKGKGVQARESIELWQQDSAMKVGWKGQCVQLMGDLDLVRFVRSSEQENPGRAKRSKFH